MPLWLPHFSSDSAAQIPNDIDFAHNFHHLASAAAPRLSDSPLLECCPFFRCSPGPANSVPDPFAGLSAAPADKTSLPHREPDSRTVNQGKSAQSESAVPHVSRPPWPEGRRCRPTVEYRRCRPCCSPEF